MKAVRIHQFGGPEVLAYEDVPDPKPRKDRVLVRVRAYALNHLDLFVRQGLPGVNLPTSSAATSPARLSKSASMSPTSSPDSASCLRPCFSAIIARSALPVCRTSAASSLCSAMPWMAATVN